MNKITVETKTGKFVERNAEIVDRVDSEGKQYSIALCGAATYYVAYRDAGGNVWSTKKNEKNTKNHCKKIQK